MSNRIPPSLKWLVKKRSEKHGELIDTENEKSIIIQKFSAKISELSKDLKSIDRVLSLHDIKISSEHIPPYRKSFSKDSYRGGNNDLKHV